jgi:predicted NAD/FAD-binding protein
MRIAIVGAGIAGLVCAHRLHPEHDITVYEAGDRLGGHSNTVRVDLARETQWIDTGFIVLNDRNYPNFEPLLAELGVKTQPSHMSFSVSDGADFEYAGTPHGLFAKRSHAANPRFLRMLADLARFNRQAQSLLQLAPGEGPSLREFLADGGYGDWFVERLIVPQAAAVWSADPDQMWSFPATFLARFFHNHGMLGFTGRPQWRTVSGGSRIYVEAISRPFADRVRLCAAVRSVSRHEDRVEIGANGCETESFDEVVIAAHSDQALAMLTDATDLERELLGAIAYQPNEAALHTDERMLPRRRAAWASWNYRWHQRGALPPFATPPRHQEGAPQRTQLTYWMNNLQSLESDTNFCVSLNMIDQIDPAKVIRTIAYAHPVFTPGGVAVQRRHAEISGVERTHFCGAYWGWGFHEDGVVSALNALERVGSSERLTMRAAA